jgi:hypothetical protein
VIEDVPTTVTISAGTTGEATAACSEGTASGGGGFFSSSASPSYGLLQSNPVSAGPGQPASGWHVAAYNSSSGPVTLTAFAVCVAYVPAA